MSEQHAHEDTSRLCTCGQELDICTRQHCPRCGEQLTRHAA